MGAVPRAGSVTWGWEHNLGMGALLKDRRMTWGWEWYPGTERCHGMGLHPGVRSGTRDGEVAGMEQNQGQEWYQGREHNPGVGEVPRDGGGTQGQEHDPGMGSQPRDGAMPRDGPMTQRQRRRRCSPSPSAPLGCSTG